MSGALAGLRVIDFGQYLAGPMTAMMLADQGADVVRVNPPGGPRWKHVANAALQRGKRSIVLDLKQPADVSIARRLVERADVLIEGFRPGVMQKLGLGPDEMTSANSRLVYCSLPGFASDDPRAGIAAWEGIIGAATATYSSRRPGGEPTYTAVPLASSYAAIIAANSIVAALIARERNGGLGQRIEVPLFNAMFDAIGRGGFKRPNKPLQRAHAASDGIYECADGRKIKTVLRANRHTAWLAKAVMPQAWVDEGFGDAEYLIEHPELAEELMRRLAVLFKTQPATHWDRVLNEAGIPCSLCQESVEWLRNDPHAKASKAVIEIDDPVLGPTNQAGYPVLLSKTQPQAQGPRHALDGDRASILAELDAAPSQTTTARAGVASLGRALEGLRVIDVTQVLAGPTAGRVLAEYGAEVIKVNNPRAEFLIYIHANGGKRSILLDIKSAEGREALLSLIERSDVFLQNFALGVADRLGLGEEAVRQHRPDVVYGSVSAYSYEGPRGGYRGWEPLGQAPTGMMMRYGDGEPQMARFSVCDYGTGICAAFALLLGLYHQVHTGEGQHVQASLAHAGTYLQLPFMVDHKARVWDEPRGQQAKGPGALDRVYKGSDRWFYVAALGEGDAQRLAGAEGLGGIFALSDEEPRETLEERFATAPAATWVARLTRAGVAAHLVLEIDEVMEDEWVKAQQLSIERDHPGLGVVRITGPGARLSRTPMQPNFAAPLPGWHTREVIEELGLGSRFDELVAMGVVAERLPDGTPLE